jgi:signal recognition particle receptor subunit beta
MPLLNHNKHEINCKIVYYGAAFGGKTTNLQYIHGQLAASTRGELITMPTLADTTLFFDFLPLDLGEVKNWQIRLSLYTVPGQVQYNASRKHILKGADAIVFVADSDAMRLAANLDSMENMIANLYQFKQDLDQIPWVIQYNKRDLATALPVAQLDQSLNAKAVPTFESVACDGVAVFSTLRGITKLMLEQLSELVN